MTTIEGKIYTFLHSAQAKEKNGRELGHNVDLCDGNATHRFTIRLPSSRTSQGQARCF